MRDGLAWPLGLLAAGAAFLMLSVATRTHEGFRNPWARDGVAAPQEAAPRGIGVAVTKDGRRRSLVPDHTSATMDRIPVRVGAVLPIDVLLWEADGRPLEGAWLEPVAAGGCSFKLVRHGEEIGRGVMTAPPGAYEQCLVPTWGRSDPLRATVRVGERPGMYTVTLSLHGGNFVRMLLVAA